MEVVLIVLDWFVRSSSQLMYIAFLMWGFGMLWRLLYK